MVEKKKYPISVLEDVQKLLQHFYTLEYRYFDVLQMKFNETHLLEIIDRQNPSFKIVISNPHQNKELKTHVKGHKLNNKMKSFLCKCPESLFTNIRN